MKEQFSAYLENPTLENFQALRSFLITSDAFDPYSEEIDAVGGLFREEKFDEAVTYIRDHLIPNHIISPGAHLALSYALTQAGDKQKAEMEQTIATLLLKGIEMTGDGTRDAPFHVSRPSDEYDYLAAHGLTFKGQALQQHNGRRLDRIDTNEGDPIFFDITEINAILARRLDP